MRVYSRKTLEKYGIIISAVIVLINIIMIYFLGHEIGRLGRFLGVLTGFLILYGIIRHHDRYILTIFLMLTLSSVAIYFFDYRHGPKIYFLLSGLSYIMMTLRVYKDIKWKEIGLFFIFTYLLIALFNVYTLNYVIEEIKYQFYDDTQTLMTYIYGLVAILCCYLIGCWHSSLGTFGSAYYLYAIFGYVLSDVIYALAMYYDISLFFYIERIIYLSGIYFFLRCLFVTYYKTKKVPIESSQETN